MTDLTAIERRLQQLEDHKAICDLKHRYFLSCDRHDVPSVRDCFAPVGAVIEFEGFPRCESRDQLVDMMNSFGGREGFFTMHHGHNPQIDITGANTATGVWALYFSSIHIGTRQLTQISASTVKNMSGRMGAGMSRLRCSSASFLAEEAGADGTIRVVEPKM